MLAISLSSFSMSISKSRRYSLFLTDKMAYELDLTDEQFEAVYEINFDYFRSIYRNSDIDLYWPVRDENMYYVLDDYQYAVYCVIDYFYDPIAYLNSRWSLGIYSYYTDRSYFYRTYPLAYHNYRGAHIYAPTYYMDRVYMRPVHHDNMHPSKTPTPDQMNNGRYANRGNRTGVNRTTGVNNGSVNYVDNNKNGKKNNSEQDDTYSVGRPSVSSSTTSSNRPTNITTRPTNNSSSVSNSSNSRSNSTSSAQSTSSTPSTYSRSTSVTTGRSNDSSTSVSSGRSSNSSSSSRSSSVSSGRSGGSSSSGVSGRGGRR